MDRKTELLVRVYFVFFGFVLFALIILGQVIKISMVDGEKWRNKGGKYIKWIEIEGERGNIYSSRGNLLSTSVPQFDINLDLSVVDNEVFYQNIDLLSRDLEKHFGKTASYWRTELSTHKKSKYYPLFKKSSKADLDLLKSFPIFNLGRNKGGFIYERFNRREKPYKEVCSRTIGLDRQNASKIGLEGTYDKLLSGEVEKRLMKRLPGDIWVPLYNIEEVNQKKGADIITTLDMKLQDIAHTELKESLQEHKAEAGTVVVMDVKTGAIKAMVNLGLDSQGQYVEKRNYAVGRSSEPGSTFKLASALVMMEDNAIDLDSQLDLNGGKKKFYDRTMYDSDLHGIRKATFQEVFEISSNVGMGTAAFSHYGKGRKGWQRMYDGLKKLGVMETTGIEIHGEGKPYFKNPYDLEADDKNRWSGTTVPWISHGYTLKMTPLQVLNVYNTVANNGRMMKPYLTQEILKEGKVLKHVEPIVLKEQMVSPATVLKAQELLKGVAERGTARRLKVDNISFAGKTGTTKINYWTDKKEYNASFAGYFPADNPVFSMIVVVYNPKGKFYGADVAGPVFRDITQRVGGMKNLLQPVTLEKETLKVAHAGYNKDYKSILDFIGVDYNDTSDSKWVRIGSGKDELVIEKKRIKKKLVPDLKGMGLRDAVYITESLGLEIETSGVGKVYKQSLKAGTALKEKTIRVYLK